ncbi:unnamed protein product [Leptidea sinapis]|uniref:Uncharacterized protein n=1 Tax=Leptidea sinapis TaxID=189913 RepID=A0A5E4QK86_9NEOP|nr:unnamed protein product [Leptidea sinapis]
MAKHVIFIYILLVNILIYYVVCLMHSKTLKYR